jgi:hypothetical protein
VADDLDGEVIFDLSLSLFNLRVFIIDTKKNIFSSALERSTSANFRVQISRSI